MRRIITSRNIIRLYGCNLKLVCTQFARTAHRKYTQYNKNIIKENYRKRDLHKLTL